MKRAFLGVVLAICVLATPAAAQDSARLLKLDNRTPVASYVRADGLGVTVFELSAEELAAMRAGRQRAKTSFSYIAYTSIGKPDLIGGIDAFDLLPLEFASYYYALAVANLGTSDHTGKVTLTLRGPTQWSESFSGVTVDRASLTVLWLQKSPLDRVGNYLFKGVMTGAGAMKSRFCAGC